MEHKRQHYIPSSYLEAWCDPSTPRGHAPYVWRFSKDGSQARNKAPRKIFYEKDMYTVYAHDGTRNLHLESNLSRVESEFSRLREKKLKTRKLLSPSERLSLCMFVASMYARTKAHGEHEHEMWQEVLDLGERVQSVFEQASAEEREHIAAALRSPKTSQENGMTIDEVREIVDQPIQSTLSANVIGLAPLLFKTPFLVLEASDEIGFITSDDPCVWFDPAVYQKPRPFGSGGLVSPTLEITFPLSPDQMLFFGHELIISGAYLPVNDVTMIDSLNKRTRLFSHEYFVSNSSQRRPSWF